MEEALAGQPLALEASAAYLLDYDLQTTEAAPARGVVGRVGYPVRIRTRAGGVWTRGDLSASVHWNHVGAYQDSASRTLEAWNTIDLQWTWSPQSVQEGLRLSLSVQNLLDTDPPLYDSANGLGFDPGQASALGRVAALQLTQRW